MKLFGQLPLEDFEQIGYLTTELIRENRNTNFIIVGASGFLGRWLSTYFAYMQLNAEFLGTLSLIVRDKNTLAELLDLPESNCQKIIEVGSLNSSSFQHLNPNRTIVFFAASSTSTAKLEKEDAINPVLLLAEDIIRHLPSLEITFIHLSSGGIYQTGARKLSGIPRNYKTLSESHNYYINEKILLENWSEKLSLKTHCFTLNPRLFSFYGPGLQIDRHFAIGEFMERARRGLPVEVTGNPINRRAYLHPRDAIYQLLLQCTDNFPHHTQIGSANSITIQDTAQLIANLHGVKFRVLGTEENPIDHYVPLDVPKIAEKDFELGLKQWSNWLSQRLIN